MHINNPKKKAIAWFAVLIVLAIIITMINRIIQVLAFQEVYVHPEMPQFLRLGVFILICAVFYFFPLLRTHHHAKKAEIRWLTILSKVLIIHFYCVLGIATIFILVSLFQLL